MTSSVSGGNQTSPLHNNALQKATNTAAKKSFGKRTVRMVEATKTQQPPSTTTPNNRKLPGFTLSNVSASHYLQAVSTNSSELPNNASPANNTLDDLVTFASSTRPSNALDAIQDDMDAEGLVTNIDEYTDELLSTEEEKTDAEPPLQPEQTTQEEAAEEPSAKKEEKAPVDKNIWPTRRKSVVFVNETTTHAPVNLGEEESEASDLNALIDALQQKNYEKFIWLLGEQGIDNPKKLRELTSELEKAGVLDEDIKTLLQQQAIERFSDMFSELLANSLAEEISTQTHETDPALQLLQAILSDTEQLKSYIDSEVLNRLSFKKLREIGDQLGLNKVPQSQLKDAIAALLLEDTTEKLEIIGELVLKDHIAQTTRKS